MSDGDTIKGALSRFYLQAPFLENKTSPLNQTAISAACCGFFFFALKRREWKICVHLLSWNDTAAWTCTTGTFQTELSFGVGFITANLCPQVSLCPKDFEVNEYIFSISVPFICSSKALQFSFVKTPTHHCLHDLSSLKMNYFFKFILFVKMLWGPF